MTDSINNNSITDKELDTLRTYRAKSGLALSAYLDLRSNRLRETAEDSLEDMVRTQLQELGINGNDQELLEEDLELVRLYLNTNGNRRAPGVAVFSCADELFWRAYPLQVPVDMHVHVGPELDVEPLLERLESKRTRVPAEKLAV